MIDQLLAIWMSILGALAGIILSLRVSVPFVIKDAEERKSETDSKIEQALKPYKKMLGDLNSDPSISQNPDGCFVHNNYDIFWKSLRENIKYGYKLITGRKFPEDIPLEQEYILTIFQTVKEKAPNHLEGEVLLTKKWQSFLIGFTNPDFHKKLEWLCSEFSRLKSRIEWLKDVESIINFLTIAVITTALLCLFSLVLLVHSNILWSYVLALLAIILFIYLTIRAIFLAKKSSGISLKKEMLCLLICVLFSLVVMYGYMGAFVVPRISESTGHQHTELKAFKGDESIIPSFLKIFGPEPSKKESLQGFNDTTGGNGTIEVVGTLEIKIIKSRKESSSEKASLKVNDVLDPDTLTKSKNEGEGLNHKNTPTNLGQQ